MLRPCILQEVEERYVCTGAGYRGVARREDSSTGDDGLPLVDN